MLRRRRPPPAVDVPTAPAPSPQREFRGGIRSRRTHMGGTFPFGKLEIDTERIVMSGLRMRCETTMDAVHHVRFVESVVTVFLHDGKPSELYFDGLFSGKEIRRALDECGWPVTDQ